MERKGRTYEREIRLAGFVLVIVLLATNLTLYWMGTRLSRQIKEDHSARLFLITELAYRQWMAPAGTTPEQWRNFCQKWGILGVGVIGADGTWLAQSNPSLIGTRAAGMEGMDQKAVRAMEEKGGVISKIYRRGGRYRQSCYLPKERGFILLAAEQDATLVLNIDRAIAFQTIFVVAGCLGAIALFVTYLRLVLAPFKEMARQARAALDGGRSGGGDEVEFVMQTYQKALDELRRQGRSLQDLYDLSLIKAERSERISRHLLESLDKGVAFIDGDGRVVSANRTARELTEVADLESLGAALKPPAAPGPDSLDQWTVEIGQGRKILQVIRSRMDTGNDPRPWTLLLVNDATAQRRLEEQICLLENTRLLKASAEGLVAKVEPQLETIREALENSSDQSALASLRRVEQSIDDLGRHLQFAAGPEGPPSGEDELLDQPGLSRAVELLLKVAPTDSTVLLTGESGTGKELAARLLHRMSRRRQGPFVSINCGALPESLIESELFGYAKGAFTGAYRDKIGLLQAADGGTFLLDEVSELPPLLQVKLLRVLQEREVAPVGGVKPRPIDIRLVAATNQDLERMVRENRFRQDLFFRLNIFPVSLPPLRDRASDIGQLAELLIARISTRTGLVAKAVEGEALTVLKNYHWPGNVRELENVLERALVVSKGVRITAEDVQLPSAPGGGGEYSGDGDLWTVSKKAAAEAERETIRKALKESQGNKSEAARKLKISYRVMLKKIKDHKLEP